MRSGAAAITLSSVAREPGDRLLRQPVDQVGVDRYEAVRARGVDHRQRLGLGLDPVDGLLHVRVEILDSDRDPVEALLAEERDRVGVDLARIDLDRHFGVGREREARRAARRISVADLVAREERRRAAAPVQLLDLGPPSTSAPTMRDLATQVPDVLGRAAMILGDDLVAGAVVADRVAERDMHVERQRRRRALVIASGERLDVVRAP